MLATSGAIAAVPAGAAPACSAEAASIADAKAVANRCKVRVEALSKRTEHAQTWVNADGTLTTGMSFGITRVKRGGKWVDVDLTLERKPGGGFGSKVHPVDLRMQGASGELASIMVDGQRIGFGWEGTLPEPVLNGSEATYPNVRPGVDLRVTVTRSGFETFLIVKDREAVAHVAEVTMPMYLGETVAVAGDDGAVAFVPPVKAARTMTKLGKAPAPGEVVTGNPQQFQESKEASAFMPSPTMWDSKEIPGTGGDHERVKTIDSQVLPKASGGAELVLNPDMGFLNDPALEFPVTLDPAVYWSRYNDEFYDTWAQNGWTSSQAGSPELKFGYSDDGGQYWAHSYLQFESSALKGTKIHYAHLRLWEQHSWSCRQAQWVAEITGGVDGNTRWGNEPGWYGSGSASSSWETTGWGSGCPDGYINMDVTNTIQFLANLYSNQGTIGLRGASSANHDEWKRVNSAEGAIPPFLEVNYNHLPTTPTNVHMGDEYCGGMPTRVYTSDTTPEFWATVWDADSNSGSDPDAQLLRAQLEISRTDGTVILTQDDDVTLINGQTAYFQGLNAALPAGVYYYRIRAGDTVDWSPYSMQCEFEVVTDAPDLVPVIAKGTKVNGLLPVTFSPSPGDETEVAGYQFGLAPDRLASYVAAGTDGTATVQLANQGSFSQRIYARAVNKANAPGPTDTTGVTIGGSATSNRVRDDFNGDGRADFIGMADYTTGRIEPYVQISTPSGTASNVFMLNHGAAVASYDKNTTEWATGDFDGDGRTDIAVLAESPFRLEVLRSDGVGVISSGVTWTPQPGMNAGNTKLVVGDFNGDGRDDVCVVFAYTTFKWQEWVSLSNSSQSPFGWDAPKMWWENPGSDINAAKFVAGKFVGGDARYDISHFYDYGGCQTKLWTQESLTGDTFAAVSNKWDSGANNWCWANSQFRVGEWNGDGISDYTTVYDYYGCRAGLLAWTTNSTGGIVVGPSWVSSGADWCAGSMDARIVDTNADGTSEANVMYVNAGHQLKQWQWAYTNGVAPVFVRDTAAGPVGTGVAYLDTSRHYKFVVQHSQLCAVIQGVSTADGGPLIQWGCTGGLNHEYILERWGGGQYIVHPAHVPGKCIDIQGPNSDNSTPLHQWACYVGSNQHWDFQYLYGGGPGSLPVAQVVSNYSGKCWDVYGVSTAYDALITQYQCHWTSNNLYLRNQRWALLPL